MQAIRREVAPLVLPRQQTAHRPLIPADKVARSLGRQKVVLVNDDMDANRGVPTHFDPNYHPTYSRLYHKDG
jgi:hypothetical protein